MGCRRYGLCHPPHPQRLQNLAWRQPGESDEEWRARWNQAFALRPREVAQTAQALASQMAQLAKLIRERVNAAIAVEAKDGPLRELHAAFKEVLLQDLTEDGFADMYAQTVTYGLFAARQSRPMGITLDNAVDMIPNTNPFLRDLLAQFTTAAGLTHALDFDELGVDALVEALNRANMEAVVADFGRAKPGEDPVIHFYEDFLREYNKKQKIQRGVFYTPKPVVSFIVRSVHELLQTEFQLPDGLASTESWGDMVAKFPDLKIPEGATPETPFVQVLDPACGTGTFLVEVIDVIYRTMTEKWKRDGHMALEFHGLWNDYVPRHLLARVCGFELMMASYTIAHMKVGLKLGELGYKFAAAERLRIYLTNTLEPAHEVQPKFDIMRDPVAQEARGANAVKETVRFTAVIGNPPYSGVSANLTPQMRRLVEPYRSVDGRPIAERGALQLEKNINDDYVKFFRFSETSVLDSVGLVGMVTNNGYLESATLRGMRASLLKTFSKLFILDLHGDSDRRERAPDGAEDENVFDIKHGVAIVLGCRSWRLGNCRVRGNDLMGSPESKSLRLESVELESEEWQLVEPVAPSYRLAFEDSGLAAEYSQWWPLRTSFAAYSSGFESGKDAVLTALSREELDRTLMEFCSLPVEAARARFAANDGWGATLLSKRSSIVADPDYERRFVPFLFGPLDVRWTFFRKDLLKTNSFSAGRHLVGGNNVALVMMRQVSQYGPFSHVMVSKLIVNNRAMYSTKGKASYFPLFLASAADVIAPTQDVLGCNLSAVALAEASRLLSEPVSPGSFLSFAYGVLNSPAFRLRYEHQLKLDFPRLPLCSKKSLWDALAAKGQRLIDLHTFSSEPAVPVVFEGLRGTVNRVMCGQNEVRIGLGRFKPVSAECWDYALGGYQPAQKWLKDRRGRVLTDEDIEHYKRIIGAIEETIRIQKEIDEVIEAHGGWPAAFQGGEGE